LSEEVKLENGKQKVKLENGKRKVTVNNTAPHKVEQVSTSETESESNLPKHFQRFNK